MDFGDAAMLAIAQGADQGNHVKAELVMRECPRALLFRTIRALEAGAGWIVTVNHGEGEARDTLEGGDGAASVVGDPQGAAAGRAGPTDGS
jgi:hypothetical protein